MCDPSKSNSFSFPTSSNTAINNAGFIHSGNVYVYVYAVYQIKDLGIGIEVGREMEISPSP